MSRFTDEELVMIAIALDEEEEELRRTWNRHEISSGESEEELEVEDMDDSLKRKWVEEESDEEQVEVRHAEEIGHVEKRLWVKYEPNSRESEGEFMKLLSELEDDGRKYIKYFRMSEQCFNLLFKKLECHLTKQDTRMRRAISAKERLAVSLRYLVTGRSYLSLSISFRMGASTTCKIVMDTCKVICETLSDETFPQLTKSTWKTIADDFQSKYNFPNCIGSLGGKHVDIIPPAKCEAGARVLLVLVDSHCNLLYADVGDYDNDEGIFASSRLCKAIDEAEIGSDTLPGTSIIAPYVMLGDEAFPLKKNLLRPYPVQKLDKTKVYFNDRLSSARSVVDETFKMLTQTFRVYNKRFQVSHQYADCIIKATCILYNFIKMHDGILKERKGTSSRGALLTLPIQKSAGRNDAYSSREAFKEYFQSQAEDYG